MSDPLRTGPVDSRTINSGSTETNDGPPAASPSAMRCSKGWAANSPIAFNLLNLSTIGFSDPGVAVRSSNFGRVARGLAGRVVKFQARLSF